MFSVPTKEFASYQVTKWAPWAFKRYILRRKSLQLQPLFYEDTEIRGSA